MDDDDVSKNYLICWIFAKEKFQLHPLNWKIPFKIEIEIRKFFKFRLNFFHEYWSFEAAHQNNFYLKVDSNVYPNT